MGGAHKGARAATNGVDKGFEVSAGLWRQENEHLRSQLPDEATQRAFEDLSQYLTAPAQTRAELRMAA